MGLSDPRDEAAIATLVRVGCLSQVAVDRARTLQAHFHKDRSIVEILVDLREIREDEVVRARAGWDEAPGAAPIAPRRSRGALVASLAAAGLAGVGVWFATRGSPTSAPLPTGLRPSAAAVTADSPARSVPPEPTASGLAGIPPGPPATAPPPDPVEPAPADGAPPPEAAPAPTPTPPPAVPPAATPDTTAQAAAERLRALVAACLAADAAADPEALGAAIERLRAESPTDPLALEWVRAVEVARAAREALAAGHGSEAVKCLADGPRDPVAPVLRAAVAAEIAAFRARLAATARAEAARADPHAAVAATRAFAEAFPDDVEARTWYADADRRRHRGWVVERAPAIVQARLDGHQARDAALDGEAPLVVLEGHTAAIRTVAFSPDGRWLATGGDDRTARIWDLATGTAIRVLKEGQMTWVGDLAFSPDGRILATTGYDNTPDQQHSVRLWTTSDGSLIRSIRGHGGGQGGINSVGFSPDGRWLVTAAQDHTARVWSATPGAEAVHVLQGHEGLGWVKWAGYAPDGRLIATAGMDGSVRLWDPRTGQQVGSVDGGEQARFSPDGRLLATVAGQRVRLWETDKFRAVREWPVSGGEPVAFTPDGRLLLACGALWEVATGARVRVAGGADISPDGWLVAGFRGNVAEVRILPEAVEAGDPVTVAGSAVTEGRRRALEAACAAADARSDLEALRVAAAAYAAADGSDAVGAAWEAAARGLADVRVALTAGRGSEATRALDALPAMAVAPTLRAALRAERDALYARLEAACRAAQAKSDAAGLADAARAFAEAFPDDAGATAWTGDAAGRASLERVAAGLPKPLQKSLEGRADRARVLAAEVPLQILRGHAERTGIAGLAFSPDGRLVASAGTDSTARIWDVATGREIRAIAGHRRDLTGIAFAPNGRVVVTASLDSTGRVWEMATGREIRQFNAITNNIAHPFVTGAVLAPTGKVVASLVSSHIEGRNLKLWLVDTGHELRTFKDWKGSVAALAFSPDGRWLCSGAGETAPVIWEVASGRERPRLELATPAGAVAWHPSGKRLATGHAGGEVCAWDFATGKVAAGYAGVKGPVAALAYVRGGAWLLAADGAGRVHIWHADTGEALRTFAAGPGVVFSPDGRLVASLASDGKAPSVEVRIVPEPARE